MRAHLEVLARVLVLVRRPDDAVHVLLSGQRHRARDRRTSAGHRLDDLPRRGVDRLVVVGLEPDADLLSRHGYSVVLSLVTLWNPVGSWSSPRSSDPRGRACRTPSTQMSHTDIPCRGGAVRRTANRGRTPTGCLAGAPLTLPGRFPYVRPSAAVRQLGRRVLWDSLPVLPAGGAQHRHSTEQPRLVCHTGQAPGQSGGILPPVAAGQTRARSGSMPGALIVIGSSGAQ